MKFISTFLRNFAEDKTDASIIILTEVSSEENNSNLIKK